MTAGYGLTEAQNFPAKAIALLGDGWFYHNYAVGGQTTINMLWDAKTQIDPLRNNSLEKDVVVAWEATNDLYFGASVADAYNRIAQYCSDRKSAGFKTIVLTLLPRSGFNTPSDFEQSRLDVNRLIRTSWRNFADGLADVGSDPNLGQTGQDLNFVYYPDKTHLSSYACDLVALYVSDAVQEI